MWTRLTSCLRPSSCHLLATVAVVLPCLLVVPTLHAEDAVAGGAENHLPAPFVAIGGSGAAGIFANRSGGGKKRALGRHGGSRASVAAVDNGLRWLARHMAANGQWSVVHHPANCPDELKCESGVIAADADANINAEHEADLACTSLALLCFLADGYDHKLPSKYRRITNTGLLWLTAQQQGGAFCANNRIQAMATQALTEAYALTSDPELREPAQNAVHVLTARQLVSSTGQRLGWATRVPGTVMDTWASARCLQALRMAQAAGLDLGESLNQARQWWCDAAALGSATAPPEPGFPLTTRLDAEGKLVAMPAAPGANSALANAAAAEAFLAGVLAYKPEPPPTQPTNDPAREQMIAGVLGDDGQSSVRELLCALAKRAVAAHQPQAWPCDLYQTAVVSSALLWTDTDLWQQWNAATRDTLVNAQRKGGGCFDGSWDDRQQSYPNHEHGRLLSTALAVQSLQCYYRYAPTAAPVLDQKP